MKKKLLFYVMITVFIAKTGIFAQSSQLYIPINIQKAFENKTRSYDGKAGANYWQNRADYKIDIEFDPNTQLLAGSEHITYFNNNPDTLRELVFHLFPDMYKKGNSHDFDLKPVDQHNGVTIEKITFNENESDILSENLSIKYEHTGFILNLPTPLFPNEHLNISIIWHYTLNRKTHIRNGMVDSTSFFIAYFFPRIAVYDDIDGWNKFKYTGDVEFYNDFGNFEVSITVPQNYLVWATGILQNPEKVLTEKYLLRYQSAFTSDDIIHIVDSTECTLNNITNPVNNTWKFKAENVTDFAFGTSNHYLWDAASLVVEKSTGRRVLIEAAYNKDSKDFYEVAKIAGKAIEYMSSEIPGVPFPFPKVTVFKGFAEMEYPMMVNNPSYMSIHSTIRITAHEIFHSYFPFYTGCNETKYAWMDEGLTTFATFLMSEALDSPGQGYLSFYKGYKNIIGNFSDVPIFIASDVLKRPIYCYNSYTKAASFFLVLQDYLGDRLFKKALQEFVNRWNGKHPTPYDLFFTFMDITGENLDWFIKPWFYEYGYVDLAVKNVSRKNNNYKIEIEKNGHYPANFELKIVFEDGSTETASYKVSIWKLGNKRYEINKFSDKKIKNVELIDKSLIDAKVSNNVFHLIDLNE